MSKITFTVDRTACEDLEELRMMYAERDFSGMKAVIERLQRHFNKMEAGLWANRHKSFYRSAKLTLKSDRTDEEKVTKLKELLQEVEENME